VRRSCDAEKLNLSSDDGDSGSKKCKRGYGGAYGGVWREYGVRRPALCWCVWQEYGFSRREDVFIFNLLFLRNFINVVLSERFAKIMLRWIVIQFNTKSIAVNFDESYARLVHSRIF
jgi:hypothetical protein